MKNLEKNSIKYLAFLILIYVLIGLILYPILDFIYCKLKKYRVNYMCRTTDGFVEYHRGVR